MQPQASLSLPDAIRSDISIYLAPDEKILKAIRSDAQRTASKGQVWLILSTGSVIFHTCETGKEPIIALLSRRDIREIEYFQRLKEVVLTFVPARSPQNVTRLSFSNEQRPELEDFCDDLADLISFKKETANGVKTYSAPVSPAPTDVAADAAPSPGLRSAASAVKHSERAMPENREKIEPVSPAAPELKPDVKIVKTPVTSSDASEKLRQPSTPGKPGGEAVTAEVRVKPDVVAGVTTGTRSSGENMAAGVRFGYIVAATVISVLVGFLWYKFFSSLARIKE